MSLEGKKFEDKTIDRLMDVFTKNLDVDDILAKCLEEELITDEDLSRIGATLRGGRNNDAVRDLMSRIKKSAPGYLEKFYVILDDSKSKFLAPYVEQGKKRGKGQYPRSRVGMCRCYFRDCLVVFRAISAWAFQRKVFTVL